jgi:hypothetical protein
MISIASKRRVCQLNEGDCSFTTEKITRKSEERKKVRKSEKTPKETRHESLGMRDIEIIGYQI